MSSTLREASKDTLRVKGWTYRFSAYRLLPITGRYHPTTQVAKVFSRKPASFAGGNSVTEDDIHTLAGWLKNADADGEIAYRPQGL
ncbi:hypothetical protein ACNKHX_07875 [Shigella flexneri]